MSLERTNYGLSNEHLFYGVSLVVYCEGKEDDGTTHDEMFWGRVFSEFGVTCVCKSSGSKSSIVPLALRAIDGNVENVVFAMDRDYGDFHGHVLENRRVIYTYGYSWENDILTALDAAVVFGLFAPVSSEDTVSADFQSFKSSISVTCSEVTEMDIQNAPTSRSLFDREKPVSIFCGVGQDLNFNVGKLRTAYAAIAADEGLPAIGGHNHDWLKVFFGKACARIIYQWFVDRSQSYGSRSKVPYGAFLRLCITLMKLTPAVHARDRYYADSVARLMA